MAATVTSAHLLPEKLDCECGFYRSPLYGKDSFVTVEPQERRQYPRIDLSQAIRIRPFDSSLPSEYCTTLNASQNGLYFPTHAGHYAVGMSVYVTTDFQPDSPLNSTFVGVVVRIDSLDTEIWGIAIHVLSPSSGAVN